MKEKYSALTPDETDISILEILQNDAKTTIKEIAKVLNLTNTPVYERIKRLEKHGYIQRYAAILNRHKLGKSFTVFCHISLKEHAKEYIQKFEEEIIHIEEVNECYHVTGKSDYLIKVLVKNMEEYQQFVVEKLAKLENIGTVESAMVMKELKHSTALMLK